MPNSSIEKLFETFQKYCDQWLQLKLEIDNQAKNDNINKNLFEKIRKLKSACQNRSHYYKKDSRQFTIDKSNISITNAYRAIDKDINVTLDTLDVTLPFKQENQIYFNKNLRTLRQLFYDIKTEDNSINPDYEQFIRNIKAIITNVSKENENSSLFYQGTIMNGRDAYEKVRLYINNAYFVATGALTEINPEQTFEFYKNAVDELCSKLDTFIADKNPKMAKNVLVILLKEIKQQRIRKLLYQAKGFKNIDPKLKQSIINEYQQLNNSLADLARQHKSFFPRTRIEAKEKPGHLSKLYRSIEQMETKLNRALRTKSKNIGTIWIEYQAAAVNFQTEVRNIQFSAQQASKRNNLELSGFYNSLLKKYSDECAAVKKNTQAFQERVHHSHFNLKAFKKHIDTVFPKNNGALYRDYLKKQGYRPLSLFELDSTTERRQTKFNHVVQEFNRLKTALQDDTIDDISMMAYEEDLRTLQKRCYAITQGKTEGHLFYNGQKYNHKEAYKLLHNQMTDITASSIVKQSEMRIQSSLDIIHYVQDTLDNPPHPLTESEKQHFIEQLKTLRKQNYAAQNKSTMIIYDGVQQMAGKAHSSIVLLIDGVIDTLRSNKDLKNNKNIPARPSNKPLITSNHSSKKGMNGDGSNGGGNSSSPTLFEKRGAQNNTLSGNRHHPNSGKPAIIIGDGGNTMRMPIMPGGSGYWNYVVVGAFDDFVQLPAKTWDFTAPKLKVGVRNFAGALTLDGPANGFNMADVVVMMAIDNNYVLGGAIKNGQNRRYAGDIIGFVSGSATMYGEVLFRYGGMDLVKQGFKYHQFRAWIAQNGSLNRQLVRNYAAGAGMIYTTAKVAGIQGTKAAITYTAVKTGVAAKTIGAPVAIFYIAALGPQFFQSNALEPDKKIDWSKPITDPASILNIRGVIKAIKNPESGRGPVNADPSIVIRDTKLYGKLVKKGLQHRCYTIQENTPILYFSKGDKGLPAFSQLKADKNADRILISR